MDHHSGTCYIVYWLEEIIEVFMACPSQDTLCDVIMALSDQIPLMATLQKRFISFISRCLSSLNHIVNLFFHLAVTNPLSSAGEIYRLVIYVDGELTMTIMNDNEIILSRHKNKNNT